MPPLRGGRASKACAACRARKTRCYESGTSSNACLRCSTLRLKCSLEEAIEDSLPENGQISSPSGRHDCTLIEERVNYLEKTVERLADIVGFSSNEQSDAIGLTRRALEAQPSRRSPGENGEPAAPLSVIREAAPYQSGPSERTRDLISKGILTAEESRQLLHIFQLHYGRWIGILESEEGRLQLGNMKSPLLLCACCLIAIRHSEAPRAPETAVLLFNETKSLVHNSLLLAPQPLEFFQAVLILSLWSTTVGQNFLSLDSWLITAFALQHGLVSNVFEKIQATNSTGTAKCTNLSIRNHLYLSHLHACVSMRRKSLIRLHDIEQSREILSFDQSTNFEVRMVAELHLYWTIYEQCIATDVNLPRAKTALQAWRREWTFLFEQPRHQFLQTSFLFAELIMYEQSLTNKSAAVRESLVTEMVRLSSHILTLSIETSDDRTKHLTDHIYHMITFAAVTLCRLLCRYENQLKRTQNIDEMDNLVTKAVQWLRGIGLASHIGHLMADIISNVQLKLRHSMENTILELEPQFSEDLAIPQFLGMESFDLDWDAILPDWQSFASDEIGIDTG